MRFLFIFVAVSLFCMQGRIIYSDELTADLDIVFYSIVTIPGPVSHKSVDAHRINIDGPNGIVGQRTSLLLNFFFFFF